MGKRIEEIERRIGDIEKDVAVLQSRLQEGTSGSPSNFSSPGSLSHSGSPSNFSSPGRSGNFGALGRPSNFGSPGSPVNSGSSSDSGRSNCPRSSGGYRLYGPPGEPGCVAFRYSEDSSDATEYGAKFQEPRTPIEPSKAETVGVFHNQLGEPYSIKLVYPGFYHALDVGIPYCTIGFPNHKEKLAKLVEQGTLFFVYITSPVRRVIGLAQAMGSAEYRGDVDARRPWVVTLEWVIGPKADGVSFADVGLEVRARAGDSVYSIPVSVAASLMERLRSLCDLDQVEVARLRERFKS